MRAGQFRPIEDDGQAYLKIPLNKIPTVSGARHPTFEDIDMQTRTLIEKLSVSSQLALPDLTAAADQGTRSIINNRPDGEASDQPTSAEIEAAAAALGLGYRYIPVVPGQIHDEDIANFSAALAELEAPVLAFCRTGTRSASLRALSAAADIASSDLLSTARAAGYDPQCVEITARDAPPGWRRTRLVVLEQRPSATTWSSSAEAPPVSRPRRACFGDGRGSTSL